MTGFRSHIHHVIRSQHHVLVMFHYDNGIPDKAPAAIREYLLGGAALTGATNRI